MQADFRAFWAFLFRKSASKAQEINFQKISQKAGNLCVSLCVYISKGYYTGHYKLGVMNMKKLIALLLSGALMASTLPAAFAADSGMIAQEEKAGYNRKKMLIGKDRCSGKQ